MYKKSYMVQMSYDISDAEKMQAEKSLMAFNNTLNLLKVATDHLNVMLTPFKDNPDISSEEIFNFRTQLRDFRDDAIDNFNKFKLAGFQCIVLMQMFSSDTQTVKLMKAFVSSIDDLEGNVNGFAEQFSDLKTKDFIKKIINITLIIKSKCEKIENIINDRLKPHIRENILSKTWINEIDNSKTQLDANKPLMVDLFNKNQKK